MNAHSSLRRELRTVLALVVSLGLLPPTSTTHAAPTPKDFEFFEKKVRPLLAAHCLECHSGDDPEGKLDMESLGSILTGGLRGPSLVPGKPNASLLITAIRHNEELKMPPKRKLPTRERAILTEWVKRGAPWPNSKVKPRPAARKPGQAGPRFTDKQKKYWAFQPPRRHPLPTIQATDWAKNPIDHFILARLEAAGLTPAPPATRLSWLRRITLDLSGLPPSPDEIGSFLADNSPLAAANVVERLLGSPAYGERWARHWLDVARYADSNGLDENLCYGNAYRYRDYVIAAFNDDHPYDQFVREQIAGDLLPRTDDPAVNLRQIIATGFLVLGAKMLAEDDPQKMEMDIIDEQIDTIGKTFLGLTLGCARCHDHKFDPIRMADYYSLAGIFKSTKTMQNFRVVAKWNERALADSDVIATQKRHQQTIDASKQAIASTIEKAKRAVLKVSRRRAGDYLLTATATWLKSQLLAGKKPLGGTPQAAKRPDLLLREAESYDRGNAARLTTGYGQGIGIIASSSGLSHVEYDVMIKKAGTARLEFRLAAADSRPCRILVNGGLVQPAALGRTTGSWFPDTQKWAIETLGEFKTGKNTIRIERQGPFPHIDKFLIVPATGKATGPLATLTRLATAIPQRDALHAALQQQWVAHLEATRSDKKSPLALWHHVIAGVSTTPPTTGPRLGKFVGRPPAELAAAYASLFTEVDDLCRKDAAAGKPKPLADPEHESFRQLLYGTKGPFKASKELESAFDKSTNERLAKQRKASKTLESSKPQLPLAMAVGEGKITDLKIHIRGNYLTLGSLAPRRFPTIIAGEKQSPLPKSASGRLELARWLTSPKNPLVPRVLVNRLWRWHFGHGLVRSTDNFGSLGERPTHPGLLDWLASELVHRNWSLKDLHRLIVLSSTYRMSTRFNESAAARDPENRLQWRMDRRRLSAEEIRDAVLFVGGSLDRRMGGSLMTVKNRAYVTGTGHNMKTDVYSNNRRSVYQPVVRSAVFDVFQAFDFADPSLPNGNRVTTTVAPQALFLMNSKLVANQSAALAVRFITTEPDEASRLDTLYRHILGRRPTDVETGQASAFLSSYRRAAGDDDKNKDSGTSEQRAWQALCRVLLAATEFVYSE
ncbi:MAG: hypothetical protein CMJ65_04405 [Planctomycetaceae bacterium]|jgi:hypothetical protein|nr:hypothetical protein [Planctomycetaceae bacterium]